MRKIIVSACVLSILVATVALAGCGGSGGNSTGNNSATPQGVAKAFWAAALKGDTATTWGMLSSELKANLKSAADWAKTQTSSSPGAMVEAGKATVKGNTATVEVKIKSGGTEITSSTVSLVKENGAWKVALP
jgi:hypothetical protein